MGSTFVKVPKSIAVTADPKVKGLELVSSLIVMFNANAGPTVALTGTLCVVVVANAAPADVNRNAVNASIEITLVIHPPLFYVLSPTSGSNKKPLSGEENFLFSGSFDIKKQITSSSRYT